MTTLTAQRHPAQTQGWRRRARHLLVTRLPWCVLGGYLLMRLLSAILMTWLGTQQPSQFVPGGVPGGHASYWDMTRMWDGYWYRIIAEQGYPATLPRGAGGVVQQNPWAFYPLYPLITRGLMVLTGSGFAVAGSLLSLAFGAGAVVLMAKLLRPRVGALAAFGATLAFSASPPSPVLQMTYTESLGLLLLMVFLISITRESWLAAAGVALLLGYTRPVAVPLGLVALVAVIQRWRRRRDEPVRRGDWARMLAALVACGVSALLWTVTAWIGTGDRSAYSLTMAAWRASDTIVPFKPWLTNFDFVFGPVLGPVLLVAFPVLLLVMMCGPWARALGAPMITWTLGYALYLAAVLDVWTSTYRYLLFMFPVIVVMIGAGWRRVDRRVLVRVRTAALVLLFLGWQVWWGWTLLRLDAPAGNPI